MKHIIQFPIIWIFPMPDGYLSTKYIVFRLKGMNSLNIKIVI